MKSSNRPLQCLTLQDYQWSRARVVAGQTDMPNAVWKMLLFYPYKIDHVQELKAKDYKKDFQVNVSYPNGNRQSLTLENIVRR
ncbi:hypothetical protein CEXT_412311 [Caerostris extrusa]|uniref:Uncharacterized protein n=1 Tax=Caerostris extrusa TaxID=172846 RepID=A0AAV4RBL4_CAEEX|nr:hypothetical protein CEXT_412311 [Caerostris extrusa]